MRLLFQLVHFALTIATDLIIAAVVLSMLRQVLSLRWRCHPVVSGIIDVGLGLCAPFRRLMERVGIPTKPLDFSPMLAIIALQALERILFELLVRIP